MKTQPSEWEKIIANEKGTHLTALVRWMKLESIIQSEVRQKEKKISYINVCMYGIYKDGTDEPICRAAKEIQT